MKSSFEGQPDDFDPNRLIEAIEKHRDDIDGALSFLRRIQSWSTPPATAGAQTVVNLNNSLDPTGIGAGEPLWSATFAILQSAGEPKTLDELAETLRESGFVSKSKDFNNTLNSVLTKRPGTFKRVKPKLWGLVEWFPDEPAVSPTAASKGKANVVPFRGIKPNRDAQ